MRFSFSKYYHIWGCRADSYEFKRWCRGI